MVKRRIPRGICGVAGRACRNPKHCRATLFSRCELLRCQPSKLVTLEGVVQWLKHFCRPTVRNPFATAQPIPSAHDFQGFQLDAACSRSELWSENIIQNEKAFPLVLIKNSSDFAGLDGWDVFFPAEQTKSLWRALVFAGAKPVGRFHD